MEVFFAVMATLFGALIGLAICAIILMVLLPIYSSGNIFVNTPGGDKVSGFHLFTKIAPGQVKIIVRGKKPVRMVMNTAGKRFARKGTKNDPSYWEIVNLEGGEQSEDPTSDINPLFRWWAKMVYETTGSVFTGIYPIQRVYEYPLARTNIERKNEGRTGKSNLSIKDKLDISDHFRTRQFLFPVHITEVETNDKIPLDVIGVCELEVINPFKAAYGSDSWNHTINNMVSDQIVQETKQISLDNALTANNHIEGRRIARVIEELDDDTEICGINITAFRILEVNPVLDDAGHRAIQAEALATQEAKATRIIGEARADNLRALNKANAEGGETAIATMEFEALVRAAEAAGKNGGSVILMPKGSGGNGNDPVQMAILAELKKLNKE